MHGPCIGIGNINTGTYFTITINPGPFKTFTNSEQCDTLRRDNCPSGFQSTTSPYCVPASRYSSTISQQDANNMALDEIATYRPSQNLLNSILQCKFIYGNLPVIQYFTRNNCIVGSVGSTVAYSVLAGKYTSIISQDDANNKAQAEINSQGQINANNNGVCRYFNNTYIKDFTKNNCPTGQAGSVVFYTVSANKYSSTIDQQDANNKAINEANQNGQGNANTIGNCDFLIKWGGVGCSLYNGNVVIGTRYIVVFSGLVDGNSYTGVSDDFELTNFLQRGTTARAMLTVYGMVGNRGVSVISLKQNNTVVATKQLNFRILGGRRCE
jgi:hypothetical protein